MPFVLDASVTLCWAFTDETNALADAALARLEHGKAFVPALWWFEVRNTLIVNERRGRLAEADCTSFLRELERFPIAIDRTPGEARVLALARTHRLTVYDAAYLELAQREGIPLATLDGALRRAAQEAGVLLLTDAA